MPGLKRLRRLLRISEKPKRDQRKEKGEAFQEAEAKALGRLRNQDRHTPHLQAHKASHSWGLVAILSLSGSQTQKTTRPPPGPAHPQRRPSQSFKASAPYPATLQHSTASSFHSCWDCASNEEHCLVPPGCTRGRERVTNTPRAGSLLKAARNLGGPQRSPGPDRERRCSQELSARRPRLDLQA